MFQKTGKEVKNLKWKQFKGKILNNFLIIDSYCSISKNGLKTWKVKLQCQRCGAEFEKAAAVDINNVKCKCMVKRKPNPIHKYLYHGKEYRLFELEKISGVSTYTINNRLKRGMCIDDALKLKFKHTCVLCGKEFESKQQNALYCCKACNKRQNDGRGQRNPDYIELKDYKCEICGTKFQSYHPNARFCCDKCRKAAARLERRKRYQNLKKLGKFDISVTLDKVYEKFDGKCCFCNKALYFSENPLDQNYPTIDHIKPISKGGAHEWNNVQLLCHHCNNVKGAKYEE